MRKKIFKIFSYLVALIASFVGGGASMSVAVGEHGSDTDPNAGQPLQGAAGDDPGKGIEQEGQGPSASAAQQADFVKNKINEFVEKFNAHRYPLHTDIMRLAKQIAVTSPEPTYFEIGEATLEAFTNAALTADDTSTTAVLPLNKMDYAIFPANSTILVGGVSGYVNGTTTQDGSPLVLYVEENTRATGVTVSALNGPTKASTKEMYVPSIPAGTQLMVMAPALSESEVEMAPDNALPREGKVYLQKKVSAMAWTDLFEKVKKEAKWSLSDIDDYRMNIYRKKCTRTHLIGKSAKITKQGGKNTGMEYAYFEQGILRQMRLGYQLADNQLTIEDLIAICAMLFGRYDTPDTLTAYCGTQFIQRLLHLNFSDHNEITVRQEKDTDTKIMRTSFECNFGKINFVHEFALDDIKYGECAIIFDVHNAKRLYLENGKTIQIDHSKGEGGEVREAKSSYYIQNDCVKLGGFNSMIVGPKVLVSDFSLSALDAVMTSVDKLTDIKNPSTGDIVYLTGDYSVDVAATGTQGQAGYVAAHTDTFRMGLYKYNGTKWETYSGKEIHV